MRTKLPRRMIGDASVAVLAEDPGQTVAPLDPRCVSNIGVLACGALECVERELLARRRLPREGPFRERASRIALDRRKLGNRDPLSCWRIGGERLREARVACFRRQPKARAS